MFRFEPLEVVWGKAEHFQVDSRVYIKSSHDTGIILSHNKTREMVAFWTTEVTNALISVWSNDSIQTMLDSVARNESVYESEARLQENVAALQDKYYLIHGTEG